MALILLTPGQALAQNVSGRLALGAAQESVRMGIAKHCTPPSRHRARRAARRLPTSREDMAPIASRPAPPLDSLRLSPPFHRPSADLTSSSTFFVGWAWVVFLRDCAGASGQSVLRVYMASTVGASATTMGLVDAERAQKVLHQTDEWAFAGALGGVLLFGPLLSVVVLTAKHRVLAAFAKLSDKKTAKELIRMQRAVTRAKLARLGVLSTEAKAERRPMRRHTCDSGQVARVSEHVSREVTNERLHLNA